MSWAITYWISFPIGTSIGLTTQSLRIWKGQIHLPRNSQPKSHMFHHRVVVCGPRWRIAILGSTHLDSPDRRLTASSLGSVHYSSPQFFLSLILHVCHPFLTDCGLLYFNDIQPGLVSRSVSGLITQFQFLLIPRIYGLVLAFFALNYLGDPIIIIKT